MSDPIKEALADIFTDASVVGPLLERLARRGLHIAPLADDGWRPMRTAPRDVATIIATDGREVSPIYWDPQHEYWCRDGSDWELHFKPVYWRPLPAAPGAEL